MKKFSVLLAFLALFIADFALAQSAVATSITGTVQVQTGTATARPLRQGDEVRQGDTIFTGAASSAVLKFDDGQIAALTANSRMTITAYQYNPQARTGNVLLSLINGGMRAITGLIGRNQPERVAYRAATATIGIRGSDGNFATDGTNLVASSNDGVHTVTVLGQTIVLNPGQAMLLMNGRVTQGTVQQILNQLPPALQALIGGLQGLTDLINRAFPGQPRGGGDNNNNNNNQSGSGNTPGGGQQGGGGGGGNASKQ
jgi:uncharacterized membrane protein YgcG